MGTFQAWGHMRIGRIHDKNRNIITQWHKFKHVTQFQKKRCQNFQNLFCRKTSEECQKNQILRFATKIDAPRGIFQNFKKLTIQYIGRTRP